MNGIQESQTCEDALSVNPTTGIEKKEIDEINSSYLKECFNYNPDTGDLTWRKRPYSHFNNTHYWNLWNSRNSLKSAGWESQGRRSVCINKKSCLVHRVIWAICSGYWPKDQIDHKDGNPKNNRIENLRECTMRQNQYNRTETRSNKVGLKGVHWHEQTNKYRAQININGKVKSLGYFKGKTAARVAYQTAAKKLHGEFYRQP